MVNESGLTRFINNEKIIIDKKHIQEFIDKTECGLIFCYNSKTKETYWAHSNLPTLEIQKVFNDNYETIKAENRKEMK